MEEKQIDKLYEILDNLEKQGKNPKKIREIRSLILDGNYIDALQKIRMIDEVDDEEDEELEQDMNVTYNKESSDKNIYPVELQNQALEEVYIGLLLNNPKLITKYYILYEDCYFEDDDLLNIYKSIIYTEGAAYALEVAKRGFNFAKDSIEVYDLKQKLMEKVKNRRYNIEKVYNDIYKLFILRKSYLQEPVTEIQDKIVEMGYSIVRKIQLYAGIVAMVMAVIELAGELIKGGRNHFQIVFKYGVGYVALLLVPTVFEMIRNLF